MKTLKKALSVLLVLCMLLSMGTAAFAASYSGDDVYKGLSGIQPGDELTLPDNTVRAWLTASWGVKVIFVDWDETELKSETVPVTDSVPGSSSAPDDPARDNYIFTGWERHDTNGDTNVTLHDDGSVTDVTGPGPIVYIASYIRGVGDLIVSKTIAGDGADSSKAFDFTVTLDDTAVNGGYGSMSFTNGVAAFSLKGGERKAAIDLPAGTAYTVTEADCSDEGYETTKSGDRGTIEAGKIASAAFTNTRMAYGSLTVNKTVAGNGADSTKAFDFTVTLGDTSVNGTYGDMSFVNGVAAFSLKGGESKTAEKLPAGMTYTVTEEDYSEEGYETTKSGDTGTIADGKTAEAAFTNTRMVYGDLTVSKTVAGNGADSTKAFDFTVTLGDTSVNGTYGDMSFVNGVAAFSLKGGESKTAENLPNGVNYNVTEDDYTADGYVTTKTGDTGAIVGDDEMTAAFTNTRNAEGSLTVSKTLAGNDTDPDKEFTFTITLDDETVSDTFSDVVFENGLASITLKGGESKTIEGLPNGVGYTVTEDDYSREGYVTTKTGDIGKIDEKTAAVAAFTNKRDTFGDLTVTKTVKGNAGDKNKEFTFTVTLSDTSVNGTFGGMTFTNGVASFTLKHKDSKTAEGLPNGVTYKIVETDYSAEGYATAKTGDTGTIVGGEEQQAEFINTKNITPPVYGALTISKNVAGDLGDKTKQFTFKVEFDADGTYAYTGSKIGTIKSGGTIQLAHGESVTILDLPAGTTYTVTESGNSGYHVYSNGNNGVIFEGKTSNARFTNIRSSVPKTGDDSNRPLWFSLFDISVLGMAGSMLDNKKRRTPARSKNR